MPDQVHIYNAYAGAFSIIHNNLDAAMRAPDITGDTRWLNAQANSTARPTLESIALEALDPLDGGKLG